MSPQSYQNNNACHLCKQKLYDVLYSLDDFNVIRCKECGLVATDLLVDKATLEQQYTSSYYESRCDYYFNNCIINNTITADNTNITDFRRGLSLIEQFGNGGKLLDVGCALGVFLHLARERGWETYGVDISQYAVSYACGSLGLDVQACELSEAGFPDEFFDVITLWDVLEHFPDPSCQLHEVCRVLKKNGIIFLNTPNGDALLRLLAGLIFRLSGATISYPVRKLYHEFHLYYFTHKTLSKLLRINGFEIVQLDRKCIPTIKARGRPLERLLVKVLSWPERMFHREYEIWAIARKLN